MEELSDSQIAFLSYHGVSLSLVFNAKGYTKAGYQAKMREEGKLIAYNTTPCRDSGHTLRTRSGHCIQCNTRYLQFQKRYDDPGVVYIAGSINGNVLKIGFTKELDSRAESLNRTCYGGFNDWEMLFAVNCLKAGKLETCMKSMFGNYSFSGYYDHDGDFREAKELIRYPYSKIRSAFIGLSKNGQFEFNIELDQKSKSFEF